MGVVEWMHLISVHFIQILATPPFQSNFLLMYLRSIWLLHKYLHIFYPHVKCKRNCRTWSQSDTDTAVKGIQKKNGVKHSVFLLLFFQVNVHVMTKAVTVFPSSFKVIFPAEAFIKCKVIYKIPCVISVNHVQDELGVQWEKQP